MRILQINNMGARHGIDHATSNHFRGILAARPQAQLVLLRNVPLASHPEVLVHTLPRVVQALPGPLRSAYRLGQAVAAVRRHRIELVHGIHLWPHGLIAWAAGKLTGRPCAISIVAGQREVQLQGRTMQRIALACLRRCDAVIVTGARTRDHLQELGVPAHRLHVIPNLTDIDLFRPAPDVAREYEVIFTGRLYPVKNLPTLLRAVALLKEHLPHVRVAIGGDGPDRMALEAQARELGIGANLRFLGFLEDVQGALVRSRLFALTSRSEGFPISVLEAMSCGLPCVASDVGDMRDVLRDGENGFLVDDCDDAEAFAAAFRRILTDRALEARLSLGALGIRETHSYAAAGRLWDRILTPFERSGYGPQPPQST